MNPLARVYPHILMAIDAAQQSVAEFGGVRYIIGSGKDEPYGYRILGHPPVTATDVYATVTPQGVCTS